MSHSKHYCLLLDNSGKMLTEVRNMSEVTKLVWEELICKSKCWSPELKLNDWDGLPSNTESMLLLGLHISLCPSLPYTPEFL